MAIIRNNIGRACLPSLLISECATIKYKIYRMEDEIMRYKSLNFSGALL